VSYSVSGGSEQSVSLSLPLATVGDAEEWTARCDLAPVRATLERWDPMLRDILDAAPFALRTALHDRELAGTIGRGRVTLVGDAAHPMLPFFAQGAAQAIEDACVLAACLADGASPRGEVPLRRYERLRAARVAEVHSRSRANEAVFHLPDGPGQAARDSGLAALSLGAFQWLYGYDAEAALGDG
jgi:salicylate hydroxylase